MQRPLLTLVAVSLFAVACGSAATTSAPVEPTARVDPADRPRSVPEAPAVQGPGLAAAVPAALDFTLPAVGGGDVTGADYAGDDVLLWFWAPW